VCLPTLLVVRSDAGFPGISSRQTIRAERARNVQVGIGMRGHRGVGLLRSAYDLDAVTACQMGGVDRQLGLAVCTSFRT